MSRPLSQEARRKAMEAAQELIAAQGIDGFTVDGVSRLSGVAKTTLYRHWSSGAELLVETIHQCMDSFEVPDTGRLRTDVRTLLGVLAELAAEPVDRRLMLDLLAAAARDPDLQRLKEKMLADRITPAMLIVERAVARGEIEPIDAELAAHLIHGPLMARVVVCPGPMTTAELDTLAAHIALGLGASKD